LEAALDEVHSQLTATSSQLDTTEKQLALVTTRSHPEMIGDMSRVTLNFDLSKIPFVRF